MTQTASVRLTLNNLATTEHLEQMEERIMSALSDAIAALRDAVSNLSVAQSPEKVAELEAAVQREREANDALVAKAVEVASAEELEDTAQAQELADAKAANDALIAEMNSAAGDLGGITAQLAAVGTAVDQAPDDTPVGEVPVEDVPAPPIQGGADGPLPPAPDAGTPAPDAGAPAGGDTAVDGTPVTPAPADGGATPGEGSTPAPSSEGTTDAAADGGTAPAADAGTPAPAAGGGPVDASGNPVDGPNL